MENQLNDIEKKKQFALQYLKNPKDAFTIACRLFLDDTGAALTASAKWPNDPEVLGFMAQAIDEAGDMHFLPTKAELGRAAWDIAADPKQHVEDRLKAMRLYGDIRGFIEKQGTVINNNNLLANNRVMLVTGHGTAEEWEQKLADQQTKLIGDASASIAARTPH